MQTIPILFQKWQHFFFKVEHSVRRSYWKTAYEQVRNVPWNSQREIVGSNLTLFVLIFSRINPNWRCFGGRQTSFPPFHSNSDSHRWNKPNAKTCWERKRVIDDTRQPSELSLSLYVSPLSGVGFRCKQKRWHGLSQKLHPTLSNGWTTCSQLKQKVFFADTIDNWMCLEMDTAELWDGDLGFTTEFDAEVDGKEKEGAGDPIGIMEISGGSFPFRAFVVIGLCRKSQCSNLSKS